MVESVVTTTTARITSRSLSLVFGRTEAMASAAEAPQMPTEPPESTPNAAAQAQQAGQQQAHQQRGDDAGHDHGDRHGAQGDDLLDGDPRAQQGDAGPQHRLARRTRCRGCSGLPRAGSGRSCRTAGRTASPAPCSGWPASRRPARWSGRPAAPDRSDRTKASTLSRGRGGDAATGRPSIPSKDWNISCAAAASVSMSLMAMALPAGDLPARSTRNGAALRFRASPASRLSPARRWRIRSRW